MRELVAVKRPLILADDHRITQATKYGWPIVAGTARFGGSPEAPVLQVVVTDGGGTTIEAAHYVIATGSAPWAPPINGLAEAGHLTSATAMDLDRLPESMIVLGGNAVGLEQAQLFGRLGVRVTVVEALDRLAPFEEPEISAGMTRVLADEGVAVRTAATVTAVTRDAAGYRLRPAGAGAGHELAAEQLLVATGRRPVTTGLGLDAVGVKVGDQGQVVVGERLRTADPRIWTAGDVTAGPQVVYVAAAHGALVVDNAFAGAGRVLDYRHLPRVTFTSPQIASVGLTDARAVEAGHRCDCRVLPLAYVPRAVVNRDTRGLITLVADGDTGRLLGAHVLADGAGEVIAAAAHALKAGMTVVELADTWYAYLTMAEGLKLAAQTFIRDISTLSCCAS